VDTFAHDILLAWYRWMWAGGWQLAALVGVVLLIDPLLRRWVWPQVRLAVWLVLAAKLLLPPMLRSPVSVTAGFVDAYSVPLVAWGVADTLDQVLPYAPMRFLLEHGSACLMRRSEIGPPGLWLWGLAAIWLAGAVVVSGHFVRQMWRLRADARRPENSAEPWLVQLTARIAREAGLRRAPRVVVSDRVSCPALPLRFPNDLDRAAIRPSESRRVGAHAAARMHAPDSPRSPGAGAAHRAPGGVLVQPAGVVDSPPDQRIARGVLRRIGIRPAGRSDSRLSPDIAGSG
jgi:hypothetical protein